MGKGHRVLVVEDDVPTAQEYRHVLRAGGFQVSIADNAKDALALVKRSSACLVVADLDIKSDKKAIAGHTAHGFGLVRTIRELFPGKGSGAHWLPVVVISGRIGGISPTVDLMKSGADDVVEKPTSGQELLKRVVDACRAAGVLEHSDCARVKPRAAKRGELQLSIPGDVSGRRASIRFGDHESDLPESSLLVLLRLMVGSLENRRVNKSELGAKPKEAGFKGISRLKTEIGPAFIRKFKPIKNDQRGHYWLADTVTIGACDIARLAELRNAQITAVATKVEALRSDGKAD